VSKDCEYPEVAAILCNFIHFCGLGPQGVDPTTDGSRPDLALEYGDHATDPVSLTYSNLWSEWSLAPYWGETIHANLARWSHVYAGIEQFKATGEVEQETADWIYNNYLCRSMLQSQLDIAAYGQHMEGMTSANGTPYSWDSVSYAWGYITSGQTFVYGMAQRDAGNIVYDCLGAYVTETMTEVWASLQDKELQVFTGIITGDLPITAFDEFVAEWNSNGGEIITEEANEWYSATFGE